MPDIEKNGYGVQEQMIQGGCKHLIDNTWKYEFEDSNGPQIYVFTASAGPAPQIGDTIVNGELVRRQAYRINNDPGFQRIISEDGFWGQ